MSSTPTCPPKESESRCSSETGGHQLIVHELNFQMPSITADWYPVEGFGKQARDLMYSCLQRWVACICVPNKPFYRCSEIDYFSHYL